MDRAFRIGQLRDVDVYRLVTSGTIEELIYTRQVYKETRVRAIVDGANPRRVLDGTQTGVRGRSAFNPRQRLA